jgi:hypothetical protein
MSGLLRYLVTVDGAEGSALKVERLDPSGKLEEIPSGAPQDAFADVVRMWTLERPKAHSPQPGPPKPLAGPENGPGKKPPAAPEPNGPDKKPPVGPEPTPKPPAGPEPGPKPPEAPDPGGRKPPVGPDPGGRKPPDY